MQTYKYTRPPEPPQDSNLASILRWIKDYHRWSIEDSQKVERAAQASNDTFNGSYRTAAPDRPQDGAIVGADGSNWNPGSGKGYYRISISGSTVSYTYLG